MKKALSLLLAFALCLSLAVPALAAGENGFTDVNDGDWYAGAVQWAVANDVTQGVSATEFGVDRAVTRAQMVTFLWRMAGSPAPLSAHGFTDVAEDAWYADAVNWAAERGVANGTSATTFSPDVELTREQAAAFLYREEQRRGGGFTGTWAFPLSFDDADQVAEYAIEPLCWLTKEGVMGGADGKLAPKGICSRAQLVTMLYRYTEELERPEEPSYTEKEVPVLRESLQSSETATLRFYEDMPNVPYMEITQYYNQFYLIGTDLKEGLSASRLGDHYVLTNIGGCTAEFDTRTDAIVTDDFIGFVTPAYYLLLSVNDESDENYPFLDSGSSTVVPETPTPLTLSMGKYSIDLRGGEDGLYVPLATLSDLYATTALRYTVYNGEKLYAQDYMQVFQPDSALSKDEDFGTPLLAGRAEDLAEFTYRELCFNIDTFYGRPGQEYIHDALEKGGLDDVLSASYPDVKEKLLATDFAGFFTGLNQLIHGLLFDGGHTAIASKLVEENADALSETLLGLIGTDYGAAFGNMISDSLISMFRLAAREKVYNGDYYIEKGDTAMIRFDEFVVDMDGWKAYYAGKGELPLEGDTLGTIYAGLQRAAANPEIRNVVFDISCNGGGDSGAMLAIEELMTGDGHINYKSLLSGQTVTESYGVDLNFDGKFDENDKPFTQFNYGVLTSHSSFSCGNAFPFFMKEHGAMILGIQSGGGACAIRICSIGGIECSTSSATSRIVTDKGETVDNGCPVDKEITVDLSMFDALSSGEVGETDPEAFTNEVSKIFQTFYDIDTISAAMNEFFGVEEQAQAA
ncbi:MAG: S-layer homology domain-containing protein [Oscillospiraceae bacterium]|nr:S-layer homology domain-containing protein [Oscillospiraceae bacterium]